jgi:hypothetical protein
MEVVKLLQNYFSSAIPLEFFVVLEDKTFALFMSWCIFLLR